jgi:hypothetical protein
VKERPALLAGFAGRKPFGVELPAAVSSKAGH